MAGRGLKLLKNAVADAQRNLFSAEAKAQGFLVRRLYPAWQRLMFRQWQTAGASEGKKWKRPSQAWEERKAELKKKRPQEYPGGKGRPEFHTGQLLGAVTGSRTLPFPGAQRGATRYHRRALVGKRLVLDVTLDYAPEANARNNFTDLSERSKEQLASLVQDFVAKALGAKK